MATKTKAKTRVAKKPALTLEQTRDKAAKAIGDLMGHPDVSPAVAAWFEKFAELILRKLDKADAPEKAQIHA